MHSPNLVESLFKRMDHNKDGRLSHEEIKSFFSTATKANGGKFSDKEIDDSFRAADANGNGFLAKDELLAFLKALNDLEA